MSLNLDEIRGKPQAREATFDRASANTEARTVELAFSSEAPYERWWGIEVLSHDRAAVNLDRIGNGANVLVNHDPADYVGVIESARVDADKRGRATVRFGRSARAEEVWRDVQDGILRSVSVGYTIDDMTPTRTGKNGAPDEYTVTRWTPYEISLVTIPADASVGVGRSASAAAPAAPTSLEDTMSEHETAAASATAETRSVSVEAGFDAGAAEEARKNAVRHICKQADIDEQTTIKWVLEGVSIQEAQKRGMEVLAARHADFKRSAAHVGLSSKELQQYSLFRMIEAVANQNPAKAGLEFEVHQAIQQKINRLPNERSFFLPSDKACHLQPVDMREARERGRTFIVPADVLTRDLVSGTPSAGGYLIGTENMSFIELLRNRSVALRMGATRLTGLVGNITVPKQTAGSTAYWLANDTTQITESTPTLGQLPLSPKNVGAYVEITRQLALQSSPSAEALIMNDVAAQVALAVDAAILEGAGSGGAPTGISATSGIGSVSGSTLAAAGVIEFMTDVAANNVVPARPGYVTTPTVAGLLMIRPELPSTGTSRLWTGNIWDGALFGVPAMTTGQVTSGTMVFGAWEHAILAEWGVLEVEVNPFANFQAGLRGIRAMYTCDVGIRYAGAFSRATSVT